MDTDDAAYWADPSYSSSAEEETRYKQPAVIKAIQIPFAPISICRRDSKSTSAPCVLFNLTYLT